MEFPIKILSPKISDSRLSFGTWPAGHNLNILKRTDINLIN